MEAIDAASSLITAFGEENDYKEVIDIKLTLQEVETLLDTALWSLRFDSPRLFFLTRVDLLHMLFEANNDKPAMYKFIYRYNLQASLLLVCYYLFGLSVVGLLLSVLGRIANRRLEIIQVRIQILYLRSPFEMLK